MPTIVWRRVLARLGVLALVALRGNAPPAGKGIALAIRSRG